MGELREKYNRYLKLISQAQDQYGFIESRECDSLLFTGLLGCIRRIDTQIDAAAAHDGGWLRRPICYGSCGGEGRQRSTWRRVLDCVKLKTLNIKTLVKEFERGGSSISRDMLLGLAYYAWYKKRLDISEGVIKYALSNRLIMGEGVITRTFMTPALLSTFAWISFRLGGPSRWWLRVIPFTGGSKSLTDFQAHLQVLHILLRTDLTWSMSKAQRAILSHHAKRQPRNPLFLIAAGCERAAVDILLDEKLWPSDRLPTSRDRKAQWLPMRDDGSDWAPSDQGHTHSGGDFLFCCWLIRRTKPGLMA